MVYTLRFFCKFKMQFVSQF